MENSTNNFPYTFSIFSTLSEFWILHGILILYNTNTNVLHSIRTLTGLFKFQKLFDFLVALLENFQYGESRKISLNEVIRRGQIIQVLIVYSGTDF